MYADGAIVSGRSDPSDQLGMQEIGSETFIRAMEQAADRDAVKAIVLRINSPGGFAPAADAMYEAARAATADRGEALNGHGWHALYWLGYIELQRGRYAEARRILDLAAAQAGESPHPRALNSLHAMRAHLVVETGEGEAAVSAEVFEEIGLFTASRVAFAAGAQALRDGDVEEAERHLAALRTKQGDDDARGVRATARGLEGLIALAEGEADTAVAALVEAAAIEDDMPLDFGPPFPPKPTHELLADVLLGLGRAEEAQEHYGRALDRAPRRAQALLGLARAAEAAGDERTAREARAALGDIWATADPEVRAAFSAGR